MSGFSHISFQQSVYALLNGDSALLALVQGVYDRPPQGSAFPYITIGESGISDWSTKTSTGTQHMLQLHVWSRNGGRKEAAIIMERLHTLLHLGTMSITGQTLVQIRFVSSDIVLEDDGSTYQGTIRFKALLESAA